MKKIVLFLLVCVGLPLCVWPDTIAWENGSVWQEVKITAYRLADGQAQFYVEPTDQSSPQGLEAGWYSGARRAEFAPAATQETLLASRAVSPYPPIHATVSAIIQGDTLRLDTGQKVRLLGADTPETTDPDRPLEFFGREAFLYTKKKVEGRPVRIEFDQRRMDNFGQLLGYVYVLSEGTFLNLDVIESGHGHAWFGASVSDEYAARFREAESLARRQQLGLWNVGRRASARRQWQIVEPATLSTSTRPSDRPSRSSSSSSAYTGSRYRSGRRSIRVGVEFSQRPSFGYGPGGFLMPGRTTQMIVQPR